MKKMLAKWFCRLTCHDPFTLRYPPNRLERCTRCGEWVERA